MNSLLVITAQVAFVATLADALILSKKLDNSSHDLEEADCSAELLATTVQKLSIGGANDDLATNPCLRASERLERLRKGEEDPEDNWEFLGTAETNSINSFVEGEILMMPKVMLLAIPHAGSTSLGEQMNMHEQLSYGKMKEHNMIWDIGGVARPQRFEAYKSTFPADPAEVKYTFDASPSLFFIGNQDDHAFDNTATGNGLEGVKEMHGVLGDDVKFIVMLRNPIDWIFSQMGSPPQMATMLDNTSAYGERTCFVDTLQNWLDVWPKNRFLFLSSEEYFANNQGTLDKVFNFLHLKNRRYEAEELQAQGRRRAKFSASGHQRNDFWRDERMKDCKLRLSQLTGHPQYFGWN